MTEETGLTLAQADMRLSKDGGAFAQKNASGNATHDSDGWYSTTLNTTDTNTVGELILNVHQPANMLPVWMRWYVVEESVYDNMFASSAVGPLTAAQVNTEVDTGISDAALATAAALATVDSNVDAILVDTGTTLPATLTTIDGNVDAILVDTAVIGAAGAGLTAVPWNSAWDAEVQSEVTDALNAYDPPTKAELDSGFAALNDVSTAQVNAEVDTALSDIGLDHLLSAAVVGADVTDNSVVAYLASSSATADWDSYVNTTDSLQAIADSGGGGPTAAQIADAVWDEDIVAAHGTADTAGLTLSELTKRSVTFSTAAVAGSIVDQIADDGTATYDRTTDSLQAIADSGGGGPTAAQIADAVWDEDATGHQTGGTFGQAIGDPGANAETIYDAVVTDAAGTNVAADIIALDTVADTINTSTAGLAGAAMRGTDNALLAASAPTNFGDLAITVTTGQVTVGTNNDKTGYDLNADQSAVTIGTVSTLTGHTAQTGDSFARLGAPAGASVSADIGTIDTVVDAILAMLDDPRAEPGQGAPAANADMATKVDYLYKWTRNLKDNDGATTQFYNDAGTVVDHKQTTSEAAGTVTKGEIVSGP